MRTVTPENSERNAFVDKAIENMRRAFDDPYVQRSLGDLATIYSGMIETAVVPTIKDNNVQAPHDIDTDALPIIAINQNEHVTMDDYYHTQTRRQRQRTLASFSSWSPRYDPTEIYDAVLSMPGADTERPKAGLGRLTLLMVTAASNVLSPVTASEIFDDAPAGVGIIKKRPVLLLGMSNEESLLSPMVGHELEHVRQYETRPVAFIKSQNNANMQALRGELEAANAGSAYALALARRGLLGNVDAIAFNLGIDLTRKAYRERHGLLGRDPFEPSGGLFRELSREGFGAMLHEAPDYERICALMTRRDTEDIV